MAFDAAPWFDHAVINCRNHLDEARDAYRRLGFHVTDRGHHPFGSSNHLMVFGDTFAELLGVESGKESQRADLMAFPKALTGLVFRTESANEQYRALQAAGVAGDSPLDFRRPVDIDGQVREAHFATVRLRADLVANGRTFFCQHFTPELVWQAPWKVHPNGALEITGMTLASHDPERNAALYRNVFAQGHWNTHGLALQAGPTQIEFLDFAEVGTRYGEASPHVSLDSCMVALRIRVRSLDTLRSVLRANDVSHDDAPQGGLIVPSREAQGVILHFVAS